MLGDKCAALHDRAEVRRKWDDCILGKNSDARACSSGVGLPPSEVMMACLGTSARPCVRGRRWDINGTASVETEK